MCFVHHELNSYFPFAYFALCRQPNWTNKRLLCDSKFTLSFSFHALHFSLSLVEKCETTFDAFTHRQHDHLRVNGGFSRKIFHTKPKVQNIRVNSNFFFFSFRLSEKNNVCAAKKSNENLIENCIKIVFEFGTLKMASRILEKRVIEIKNIKLFTHETKCVSIFVELLLCTRVLCRWNLILYFHYDNSLELYLRSYNFH